MILILDTPVEWGAVALILVAVSGMAYLIGRYRSAREPRDQEINWYEPKGRIIARRCLK